MEQEQVVAAAIAAALAAAASAEDHQTVRRVVHRSTGKWRGSTLAGDLRTVMCWFIRWVIGPIGSEECSQRTLESHTAGRKTRARETQRRAQTVF